MYIDQAFERLASLGIMWVKFKTSPDTSRMSQHYCIEGFKGLPQIDYHFRLWRETLKSFLKPEALIFIA